MTQPNPYELSLDKVAANFQPLSPLTFIARSAATYPDHPAIIHGSIRRSWSETFERCRRLASALRGLGVGNGDTVAVMGANTPELYEAHFGVPATGGVLNALNIRLDARAIAFILDHGNAKVVITDSEYSETMAEALGLAKVDPVVVDIVDGEADGISTRRIGSMDYEALLAESDPGFPWTPPSDEWQAISLNYTSGTTGNPKGVVYHHRGAYLNAVGNAISWGMGHHPVYLWTLPMFHCNGWCFPWTVAALAGTNVCLRRVAGDRIYAAIAEHRVTHLCGAPIVMNFIASASSAEQRPFDHAVRMMTAAAPPPASLLERMQRLGFVVTHVYGLTETYGPAVVCAWHDEWSGLPVEAQAELKSRQGVRYHVLDDLRVKDPDSLADVPADGETMGEVMFRGNIVMKGYLHNPDATRVALSDGWFHSGDLAVLHPDGYIQLKDRSKDIIISGGENISSIEVENVIYRHPSVMDAAVVARPDDKWGETPCAFIELRDGAAKPSEDEMIAFCRDNLAHFKCPRTVVFGPLPKTSTGKIQKFVLRNRARDL
jgi:fatty-acyl-CoA synthase